MSAARDRLADSLLALPFWVDMDHRAPYEAEFFDIVDVVLDELVIRIKESI